MAIVTFWGTGKEQVGKTLSVVAIATNMAIEHNKRILLISASFNNETLKNCYWTNQDDKKSKMFIEKNGVELENGIEGLAKMVQSNKISPQNIIDYTKVVFKDRLEVLLGFETKEGISEEDIGKIYAGIIQVASHCYDIIFVDLDNEINTAQAEEILKKSDLVVNMVSQKVSSIKAMQNKAKIESIKKEIYLIGKYDKKSKYTVKNLSRLVGSKGEFLVLPYNTLYFEASQEGNVPDLLLRLRRIEDKNDENAFFMENVKKVSNEIEKGIQKETFI